MTPKSIEKEEGLNESVLSRPAHGALACSASTGGTGSEGG